MSKEMDRAVELRSRTDIHYNCAQTVLCAFADTLGMTEEEAFKLGSHFGGGMKMGATCGVITSGLMILGMAGKGEVAVAKQYVDGFRTDVEQSVPEDFWEEGRRRIEAIKPEVVMLAESENPLATVNAYDISYGFTWSTAIRNVFLQKMPASHLIEKWTAMRDKMPQGTLFLRNLENHDISMDLGDGRWNMVGSPELVQAATLLNFTIDGIPFIYNGEEIADNAHHSIFANRDHGKNFVINWSLALSDIGEERLDFTKSLTTLRHGNVALQEGETVWLENDRPDAVLAFLRVAEEQTVLTVVNTTDEPLSVVVKTECGNIDLWGELLSSGAAWRRLPDGTARFDLLPYGYTVQNI